MVAGGSGLLRLSLARFATINMHIYYIYDIVYSSVSFHPLVLVLCSVFFFQVAEGRDTKKSKKKSARRVNWQPLNCRPV